MNNFDTSKQIAVGITFLLCCVLLILLSVIKMTWSADDQPEPDPYIALAEIPEEEFIEVETLKPQIVGNETSAPAQTPENLDNESQPGPQSGMDLSTQGRTGEPAKPTTQQQQSPVQEKPQKNTSQTGAAVDNKEKEKEEISQRTNNQVANAFANVNNRNNAQNGNKDDDNAGRQNGNPQSAAGPNATGTKVGVDTKVGGGWKVPAYSRSIPSNEVGSVTFEVEVKQDGSVGRIVQTSNNGLSSATIGRCRDEIKRHKFKHTNLETAQETTAYITFTFQDPK